MPSRWIRRCEPFDRRRRATPPRLAVLVTSLVVAAIAVGTTVAPSAATAAPRAKARPLTVMTYNIHHGAGLDGRLDLDRIAGVIRASGADVVALQEVDRHFGERSAFADQPTVLAQALGMHVAYGPNLDLEPLTAGAARRQYGNAVLSRYAIRAVRNTLLPGLVGQEQRGLLEVDLKVRGVPVHVAATHLQHDSAEARRLQARAVLDRLAGSDTSTVLLGDLNARPGDAEIETLLEVLVDAWVTAGVGTGATSPAAAPSARIDYVLHSDDVVARTAAVVTSAASDHLPVVASLLLPGDRVGGGRVARP